MENGIRQGDVLAPTMFNLYVNDLITELKQLNCGVNFGDENISTLMYADDLCLVSENEEGVQLMLKKLQEWAYKWRLCVNTEKTCVIHFRKKTVDKTNYIFQLCDQTLQIASRVRYLGLELNEHMDYTIMANILADSSSRALGKLTHKFYQAKGLLFDTYHKLFNGTVLPVMEYAAEIWGHNAYNKLDTVQLRAYKTFLGVGKTCPTPFVRGETASFPTQLSRHIKMLKYFNCLKTLHDDRLVKRVFNVDFVKATQGQHTWCKDIKGILTRCDNIEAFSQDDTLVNIEQCDQYLKHSYQERWQTEMVQMHKLTVYCTMKNSLDVEQYVTCAFLSRQQRAVIAQIRSGTLAIEEERGRWRGIARAHRICKQCNSGDIENTEHFLLVCETNNNLRNNIFGNNNNMYYLLKDINFTKRLSKYILTAFQNRH